MKFTIAVVALYFASAYAVPINSEPPAGVYCPPKPTDSRSPCPGLNALANHGWLPRDGRNITSADIISAMDKFLGIRADVGAAQIAGATQLGAITTLPSGHTGLASFDVLSKSHNLIEHDGSFTRNDVFFTPEPKINKTRVATLLSFSSDKKYLTPLELSKARQAFLRESFTINPNKTLGKLQTDACWRENGLIQLVIGWNETDGKMRVDWLRQWFLEERLPFNLGWTPAPTGGDIADATRVTTTYIVNAIGINAADPLGPLPLVFQ